MDNTFKSKIEAIRELLGVKLAVEPTPAPTPEPEPVQAEAAKATLTDGTELVYEGELKEGTALMVVTPTGNQPAPDGAHQTMEGMIITTVGGVVTSVEEAVVVPEVPEIEEDMTAKFSALYAEIETLKTELANVKSEASAELNKVKEAFSATVEIVEAMNAKPAVPTPTPINAAFAKRDQTDAIAKLAASFKSLKN